MLNISTETIDQLVAKGRRFLQTNQPAQAETAYRKVLAIQPQHGEAIQVLGMLALQYRKFDVAIELLELAVTLAPKDANSHNNLGNALKEMGRIEEAIVCYERALALSPNSAVVLNNLGQALHRVSRLAEGRELLERAVAANPQLGTPHKNLGQMNYEEGRIEEAIACYQRAIEREYGAADAHWNLSIMHLLRGDFEKGWKEYEWRWRCAEFRKDHRYLERPRWEGESFAGKTILLHAEQGFGDALQFVRYLPQVVERGGGSGKVMVECQPEMKGFLERNFSGCAWYAVGETIPVFDVQSPLMSLPRAFGTTVETIPSGVPYLRAEAECAQRWGKRMEGGGMRVGISWAGRETHGNDRNRSIPVVNFLELLKTPGVRFFSLQKSGRDKVVGRAMGLIDYTEELSDFAETAGLAANLDLVICVDTAIAHLAGAMGKRVWLMLPFVADWRWMMGRSDSPWYPGMRIYRQEVAGKWGPVLERVQRDLRDEAVGKNEP